LGTYQQFQTDANLETSGIRLNLGTAGTFIIARAGGSNEKFARRMLAATKPFRRAIASETMNSKEAEQLTARVFAETVVLGWEGVTGPDGKELAFNVDNAVKLFTDLPDLFAEIRRASSDAALFRKEILESEAGNSSPASSTP
jgi:hypothetical protein